jgi:hypothetical protein
VADIIPSPVIARRTLASCGEIEALNHRHSGDSDFQLDLPRSNLPAGVYGNTHQSLVALAGDRSIA